MRVPAPVAPAGGRAQRPRSGRTWRATASCTGRPGAARIARELGAGAVEERQRGRGVRGGAGEVEQGARVAGLVAGARERERPLADRATAAWVGDEPGELGGGGVEVTGGDARDRVARQLTERAAVEAEDRSAVGELARE